MAVSRGWVWRQQQQAKLVSGGHSPEFLKSIPTNFQWPAGSLEGWTEQLQGPNLACGPHARHPCSKLYHLLGYWVPGNQYLLSGCAQLLSALFLPATEVKEGMRQQPALQSVPQYYIETTHTELADLTCFMLKAQIHRGCINACKQPLSKWV